MRWLAEIQWCETHKQSTDSDKTCYGFFDRRVNPCVVVDAQVTERCADCNGSEIILTKRDDGKPDDRKPCPSCSEEAPPVAAIQAALLLKESILTQTAFPNSVTALITAAERVVAAYRGTDDGT